MDANVTLGRTEFRYAPSVGVFSIAPGVNLLDAINASARNADPAFEATSDDIFSVGHRFIGHGNRDWRTSTEEYDASARYSGADSRKTSGTMPASAPGGSTVRCRAIPLWDAAIIRDEILAGRYDLTDPLSKEPDHLGAIERSSLREKEDFRGRYLGVRLALEGAGPGIGGRTTAWTAGIELDPLGGPPHAGVPGRRWPDPRRQRSARLGRHQLLRRARHGGSLRRGVPAPRRHRRREGRSEGRRCRRRRWTGGMAALGAE